MAYFVAGVQQRVPEMGHAATASATVHALTLDYTRTLGGVPPAHVESLVDVLVCAVVPSRARPPVPAAGRDHVATLSARSLPVLPLPTSHAAIPDYAREGSLFL